MREGINNFTFVSGFQADCHTRNYQNRDVFGTVAERVGKTGISMHPVPHIASCKNPDDEDKYHNGKNDIHPAGAPIAFYR